MAGPCAMQKFVTVTVVYRWQSIVLAAASIDALSLLLLAAAVLKAGRHRNRKFVVPILGQIAHEQVAVAWIALIVTDDTPGADDVQPVRRSTIISLRTCTRKSTQTHTHNQSCN